MSNACKDSYKVPSMASMALQIARTSAFSTSLHEHNIEDSSTLFVEYSIAHNKAFWFEDGNVIINVHDQEHYVRHQYRVHRSILCMHSSWWRQVFARLGHATAFDAPFLCGPDDDDVTALGQIPYSEIRRLTDPVLQGEPVDGIPPIEAGFGPQPYVFERLLRRLYHPTEFAGPQNDALTSHYIHSLLQLTDLFGMAAIRADLISELSRTWPSTLEEWDDNELIIGRAIEEEISAALAKGPRSLSGENPSFSAPGSTPADSLNPQHGDLYISRRDHDINYESDLEEEEFKVRDAGLSLSSTFPPSTGLDFPDPAEAILVARVYNIPSILPAACYNLARMTWHQANHPPVLTERFPYSGSELQFRSTDRNGIAIAFRNLNEDDLLRIILGRERLQELMRRFAMYAPTFDPVACGCMRALHPVGTDGQRVEACRKGVQMYWSRRLRAMIMAQGMEDPLQTLAILAADKMHQYQVCLRCKAEIVKAILKLRESIWASLGDIFSLWDEPQ